MPAETGPRAITTKQIPNIPLYLIPKTIADEIKGKHTSVYRITVEKKFHHCYAVTVETRDERVHKEAPARKEGDEYG